MADLRLGQGAATGAHPDCPGQIELLIDHYSGGWSGDCGMSVSLHCEWRGESPGCWWSREVDGVVTAQTFTEALLMHQRDSVAWDLEHTPATPPTTTDGA